MANLKLPPITSFRKTVGETTYTYFRCSFGKVGGEILKKQSADRMTVAKWREATAKDLLELGEAAAVLTREVKMNAVLALNILPEGVTLLDAAQFYANHKAGVASISTHQAAEEYIEHREDQLRADEIREATFRECRIKVGALADRFTTGTLDSLNADILMTWLKESKGLSANSLYQYLNVYSTFFKWAMRRKYLSHNPLEDIKRPKRKRANGNATFLTVEECQRLLETTRDYCPKLIPYFALGMFAGLRPSETERIKWDSINVEDGLIRVESSVSKTDDARCVTMSSNLQKLLAEYYSGDRYVYYARKKFDMARSKAKVKWDDSILRHTFATYHLALYGDAARTAYELGHRDADLLFRHYRGMASTKDAERFWSLTLTGS